VQILQRGDKVRFQFQGRTIDAMVILASVNGRSLILSFEGLVSGYVGMMPVVWEDDFMRFVDLIHHDTVRLVQPRSKT